MISSAGPEELKKNVFTHCATIYKDRRGMWRWRIKSRNGRIVADSGEGYKQRAILFRSLTRLLSGNIEVRSEE